MTSYKYETHLHTSESSDCARSSGADLVLYFKKLGYTGIFVTDHFLDVDGSTSVPKELPWPKRIELFCHGYDIAAQKGRQVGLDVFLGWEYSYGWAHFLTYGLGKDWLLAHPDLLCWNLLDYFDRVHEAGGSIVHAHPFRQGVDIVQLVPGHVDAVEVLSAGRCDEDNRHALDYANSFGLPKTAGSDTHRSYSLKRLCGMSFPRRLTDAKHFITAVKSNEGLMFDDILPVPLSQRA